MRVVSTTGLIHCHGGCATPNVLCGDVCPYCHIVCRCYAALGDVAKVRYLREISKLADKLTLETVSQNYIFTLATPFFILSPHLSSQGQDGTTHYLVEAKMAALNKQLKQAEAILLERVREHTQTLPDVCMLLCRVNWRW